MYVYIHIFVPAFVSDVVTLSNVHKAVFVSYPLNDDTLYRFNVRLLSCTWLRYGHIIYYAHLGAILFSDFVRFAYFVIPDDTLCT